MKKGKGKIIKKGIDKFAAMLYDIPCVMKRNDAG